MTTGHIVIYEPDDLMHSLLVEWLRQAGYEVSAAAQVDRDTPADLVIISLHSPKRQGSGVIRAMRIIHPRTPFIATSSQFRAGLSPIGTAARELGVERALAKPLARDELLAAVAAVIGTRGQVESNKPPRRQAAPRSVPRPRSP
jgi:two-component system chemotaxis response regulator CheY